MGNRTILFLFFSILLITLTGCGKTESELGNRVVIGISSDVTTFNPLFTFNMDEGNVTELIYLGLVGHGWDENRSDLTSFPLLAESWEWVDDSTSIIFKLREDISWSDGVKFTAEDVLFSFDLYSDPVVQSRFYGGFENYYTEDDLSIDLSKSIQIISGYTIKFNFKPGSVPSLFDADMPIIPKHIFEKIERENLSSANESFSPVGTGPYKFSSWKKNQSIILQLIESSPFAYKNSIKEIVFKIIPDYNSSIIQLKKGEIDIIENVRSEELKEIENYDNLTFAFRKGREYDYVGWNNIDPLELAENGNIIPNKLFGNKIVRRALTHAINREMILQEFLGNYGELSTGPIAPIFKWAINDNVEPYKYDPVLAKELLNSQGWIDSNNDGIRDKDGVEFSFDLNIPGGHPRRSSSATVIINHLKAVGIEVNLVTLEPSILVNQMFQKKLDAWISGWAVPIPLELRPFWHSDLENAFPNVASYMSPAVDILLDDLEKRISKEKLSQVYRSLHKVIHEEEPVTFLYWVDNIVVYNSRIKNIDINPLGSIHYCWNWSLKE